MERVKPFPIEEKNISSKEADLPDYISMYDISGQDKITGQSFRRYVRDKEQDQKIKDRIDNSATAYVSKIESAPEAARAELIMAGLKGKDRIMQRVCAEAIELAPIYAQASLREKVAELIKVGLDEKDVEIQKGCAEAIELAPVDAQFNLRKKVAELIRVGLDKGDPKAQRVYAEMISFAPEKDQTDLLQSGLDKADVTVQEICAGKIFFIAWSDLRDFLMKKVSERIRAGLVQKKPKAQRVYAEMISFAPENDQVGLLQSGLDVEDPVVQKACAEIIWYVPKEAQVGLKKKVAELIKAGLNKEDAAAQKVYVQMISDASENIQKELFQLAQKKLGNALVEPPLYQNSEISKDKFQRVKFSKTGSETTLIGGQLKDKTIMRHLEPEPFLTWQKLYEDHEMWKQEGFDYVPIEPIQSYRLNKNGLVDVFSGVLDLSLDAWQALTGDFKSELGADRDKIVGVLKKQGVEHGHPHNNNFCLRFFRNEKGNVDFSRKPRIYLIDFDAAKSP